MKKFIALSIFLLSFQSPLSAMMRSPHFDNEIKEAKILRAQQKIDRVVCETVPEVYEKINANWTYVTPNANMSVTSTFWKPTWFEATSLSSGEKIKTRVPTLIFQSSEHSIKDLTEALDDLINKPVSTECTIALTTAKIFCMKNIMGNKEFKEYATNFYNLLDSTEGWSTNQFFHELPLQFMTQVEGNAVPGSISYITNLSCYGEFKPNGNARGSNVFCVNECKYLGFSSMYRNGPQPLEAIEQQDYELLCDRLDVERDYESHEEICKELQKIEGLFEALRRKEQTENYNFHFIFDGQKIKEYRKTAQIDL